MEGYLRDWRGEAILGPAGHPLPIEWYHDVDEYGRLRLGASKDPPPPVRRIVRPTRLR